MATSRASAPPSPGRPERTILIIGGLVALLVVAAIAAVLTLGRAEPASYPPDSPEAALQAYLEAVEARDLDTAYGSLSSAIRAEMSREAYARTWSQATPANGRNARVRIDRVSRTGEAATLYLTVERFYGSGLDSRRTQSQHEVRLVREGGVWKINQRQIYLG